MCKYLFRRCTFDLSMRCFMTPGKNFMTFNINTDVNSIQYVFVQKTVEYPIEQE